MFKLRIGYLIVGITTGLIVLLGFFTSLPDGKLHIVFCNVGQGDAAYIRFPDGRDMLVDGGPDNKVLDCLGRHMPFWDRHINLVLLTHPQKDHMQGLITVLDRYSTDAFVRSDITNTTDGYKELLSVVKRRNVKQKFVTTGETVAVGSTTLSVLWPSSDQIAKMNPVSQRPPLADVQGVALSNSVLGASTSSINLNDGSIVFALRYGAFDALFTGDADIRVESLWRQFKLADSTLEVLKYPHHGSKTAMTGEFLGTLFPSNQRRDCSSASSAILLSSHLPCPLAVISVGKNSYGHPSEAALAALAKDAVQIKRTDKEGDIEVVSDGKTWNYVVK
ncbi:MAG: MBL fold metallo-hydrolase [Candidatus Gottesmanbacteria bacterium]|nr:MBL fold metallo-hydrolase [Candidatus Gottesmanbacteria bacterium]